MKKVSGFTIIELVMAVALLAIVVAVFSGSYVRSLFENKNNYENIHELDIRRDFISYIDLSEFSDVIDLLEKEVYVVEQYDNEGNFFRKFSSDIVDKSACNYVVKISAEPATDAFLPIECEMLKKSAEEWGVVDTFKAAKLR